MNVALEDHIKNMIEHEVEKVIKNNVSAKLKYKNSYGSDIKILTVELLYKGVCFSEYDEYID